MDSTIDGAILLYNMVRIANWFEDQAVIRMQQERFNDAVSLLKKINTQKGANNSILLRAYFLNTEIVFSLYRKKGQSKEVRSLHSLHGLVVA